jgi:hypothetical protein
VVRNQGFQKTEETLDSHDIIVLESILKAAYFLVSHYLIIHYLYERFVS